MPHVQSRPFNHSGDWTPGDIGGSLCLTVADVEEAGKPLCRLTKPLSARLLILRYVSKACMIADAI